MTMLRVIAGLAALVAALVLAIGAACGVSAAEGAGPPTQHRMLFTGDILLSRQVAREIEARGGVSPWRDVGDALKDADVVFGNLEGAVGSMDDCQPPKDLCFAVSPRLVPLLRQAGFTVVGAANNHSGDLGAAGRRATREALEAAGLAAVGLEPSPTFLRLGPRTVGLVGLSLVPGRDGVVDAVPSWQAARALRLARALADFVVVSVHWGRELADWVSPEQEAQARWLVAHGADVVIGAHPHVIQPPECVDGRPVFYSLGNHVFDQKYPATKRGLIAACSVDAARTNVANADAASSGPGRAGEGKDTGVLTCGGMSTETPVNSSFPRMAAAPPDAAIEALAQCPASARRRLTVSGQTLGPRIQGGDAVSGAVVLEGVAVQDGAADRVLWRSPARRLLSIASGRLAPDRPAMLFTVERHVSPIDDEDGPRPYVYDVTPHGLVARWRGSALAWPLLDATLIEDAAGRPYVCALHRGDSFVMLDSADPAETRTQVYAWNGFGFSGTTDGELTKRCAGEFEGQAQ
jgi:poly-gamma-glutamate synthesis protein (capsule biosynthesis protein)